METINNKNKYEIIWTIQFKNGYGNLIDKKYVKYFGTEDKNEYIDFCSRYMTPDFEVEEIRIIDATYHYDSILEKEIEEASK